MDLTREYILWKLGTIGKSDIIALVDQMVANDEISIDEVLDISLAADKDDLEFTRIVTPFINEEALNHSDLTPIVIEAVKTVDCNSAIKLLNGLNWMVYDLGLNKGDSPIGSLYYNLDHLYNDAIPGKYAKLFDVTIFLSDWLKETAT